MIQRFADKFIKSGREQLAKVWAGRAPQSYKELVQDVVSILADPDDYAHKWPDPNRVYEINDGNYQGTLVFVIGETGYQPDTYWYVKVDYGSCSGCDTLEHISLCYCEVCSKASNEGISMQGACPRRLEQYLTLALHVVQKLKELVGEDVCSAD